MLINPHADGEARPTSDQQDASQQKYETMQCFAVSEPKSIKEEGEGWSCLVFPVLPSDFISLLLSWCCTWITFSVFFVASLLRSFESHSLSSRSLFCYSMFPLVLPFIHVLSCWYFSFNLCRDFLSFLHHFSNPNFPKSLVFCPPFITTPLHLSSHLPRETN